jgi:virulence-associated protein VapD
MNLSPILIIAYNRYEKITQILNILKNVKNLSSIYFKIDGPRNKQDLFKIKNVIRQIKNFKKFTNKKIFIKTEEYNLGLKNNIISGINWAFSKEDKLIILEDDNIFDISFLSFSTKILKLYEKNENIFHIPKSGSRHRLTRFSRV